MATAEAQLGGTPRARFGRTRRRTKGWSLRSRRRARRLTRCRRWMCRRWMPRPCWAIRIGRTPGLLPELSEIEIIRHFTRLSTWNYAIDLGMYPLGSCTMKYNPRVNEFVARIEGLAEAHPYRPESLAQGVLESWTCCSAACSRLPAWKRSRCSRLLARMASSPEFCWFARGMSRRGMRERKF